MQAAERAAAGAASARTQQDSGPGWEPSRRPRAGAGRWSRVFRPRSVQLGWETARAGGGAPRESSAAAAPQCGREKQLGGRRSKQPLEVSSSDYEGTFVLSGEMLTSVSWTHSDSGAFT